MKKNNKKKERKIIEKYGTRASPMEEVWRNNIQTNTVGLPPLNVALLPSGQVLAGYHWQGFHLISRTGQVDESHRRSALKSYDHACLYSDAQGVWSVSDDHQTPNTLVDYYDLATGRVIDQRAFRIESNYLIKSFIVTETGDWYVSTGLPFWFSDTDDIITKYSPTGKKLASYTGLPSSGHVKYLEGKLYLLTKEKQLYLLPLLEDTSSDVQLDQRINLLPDVYQNLIVDFLVINGELFILTTQQLFRAEKPDFALVIFPLGCMARRMVADGPNAVLVLLSQGHEPTHTELRLYRVTL